MFVTVAKKIKSPIYRNNAYNDKTKCKRLDFRNLRLREYRNVNDGFHNARRIRSLDICGF